MRTTSLPVARPAPQTETQPGHPTDSKQSINAKDFSARIKALSDDYFQGRGPGTARGEEAAQWIADELKRIGVQPGVTVGKKKSYFQEVPAVNIALDQNKSFFVFNSQQGPSEQKLAQDVVFWSAHYDDQPTKEITLENSQLIFAGYGVNAPEQGKNDYAGLNVRGKTVVVLANEPGQTDKNPDPSYFEGKDLTYYGRWTYKIEEAKRQGAAGVLIVHDNSIGPWNLVVNSRAGTHGYVQSQDKNESRPAIEGFISTDSAKELFKRAGLDFDAEKAAAKEKNYKGKALTGQTLSATAHSTTSQYKTRNVVGILPGAVKPDEYVLYTAHWDHLGMNPNVKGPDKIYNGAIDNGSGCAGLLEIAEASKPEKNKRSKAFVFTTLEEQGLLGAEYFAQNPVWKPSQIVADMNFDELIPSKPTKDVIIVGQGASKMDELIAASLKKQGRVMGKEPDSYKAAGYRFRHDGLAFGKVGIPYNIIFGGNEIDGDKTAGQKIVDEFEEKHYHQPSDEWDPKMDFSGPIMNLKALKDVGDTLANSNLWPDWYPGNQFKAIRDKDRPSAKILIN
jgi:Zn-dependent M28 family amino/carboxypeptidase